jgi:peptide/nickel transport system permease protein
MTTKAATVITRQARPFSGLWAGLRVFWIGVSRNRAGFIGFLGILFYILLVTLGPVIVPFDNEVKLDEIAAPAGSRIQLMTRRENVSTYTSLESLNGKIVGVIGNTGGPKTVEPYADTFEIEEFRWQAGRGVDKALEALTDGDIDALVIFSQTVKDYVDEPEQAGNTIQYADVAVSNPGLGSVRLLGTDTQGRDIFSHIMNGGASLILTALLAGLFSTLIAFSLGSLAALVGGMVDRALVAVANFVLVIPRFPLLVVLAAFIQLNNFILLATLIALLSWPTLMRAVRAQVLSLRERDYVEAAVALDLGRWHIMTREILPNMISFVAINLIFAVTGAMYEQVGLIFLGMAPINDYNWGVMLYFGRSRGTLFNPDSALMVLAPVFAIAFFQVSMVMFARALEEIFNPRLRSSL